MTKNDGFDSGVNVNTWLEFDLLDELAKFSAIIFVRVLFVLEEKLTIRLSLSSSSNKSKFELTCSSKKLFLPVTQKNVPFLRFGRWEGG